MMEKSSTGFLEGTLLVPPEAKKKKNRKTVLRDHKKTAEGIKNDTATDTDSVAVVSDMTSDFAGNAEHGETVRQDQKDLSGTIRQLCAANGRAGCTGIIRMLF